MSWSYKTRVKMEELERRMPRIHKMRKRNFSYRDMEGTYGYKWHHVVIMRHYKKWLATRSLWWKIKEKLGLN